MAIPDHVAAYAAGLYTGRVDFGHAGWVVIALVLADVGLGSWDPHELAEAAEAWERAHVSSDVLERLRRTARNT